MIRPKMRAAMGVDEWALTRTRSRFLLHRAFEYVANAELLADLLGVDALALVGKGSVARDDEAVANAATDRW